MKTYVGEMQLNTPENWDGFEVGSETLRTLEDRSRTMNSLTMEIIKINLAKMYQYSRGGTYVTHEYKNVPVTKLYENHAG